MNWSVVLTGIRRALALVEKATVIRVLMLAGLRVVAGVLDVVGVLFLAIFSTQALLTPNKATQPLRLPMLASLTDDLSARKILTLAITCLICKSALSYLLAVRTSAVLNRRCSELIAREAENLAMSSKADLDQLSTQRFHFLLTSALRATTVGVLSPLVTIISEASMLVMLLCLLVATSVVATLASVSLLGLATYLLYRFVSHRQYRAGQELGTAGINSMTYLQEAIHGYRELLVRGSLGSQLSAFVESESIIGRVQTKQLALGILPRYTLEGVVMLGLGSVALVALSLGDSASAVLILAVFTATTSRMLPSLIPLQAAISELTTNLGFSSSIEQVAQFVVAQPARHVTTKRTTSTDRMRIVSQNLFFSYPESSDYVLRDINLDIQGPGWIAITGISGSGKSTLVDLVTGVQEPTKGSILIDGMPARDFVRDYPGVCAYLPQRITTIKGSIAENVAMRRNLDVLDHEKVRWLLDQVGLDAIYVRSELGVHEQIGELGESMSGGQLQRLGIARCLFSNPEILILDESTTGLDPQNRDAILQIVREIADSRLVLMISHDTSVERLADRTLILNQGQICDR